MVSVFPSRIISDTRLVICCIGSAADIFRTIVARPSFITEINTVRSGKSVFALLDVLREGWGRTITCMSRKLPPETCAVCRPHFPSKTSGKEGACPLHIRTGCQRYGQLEWGSLRLELDVCCLASRT